MHANGVVHSDVKPDNVLIDASGRPRLGDFDVSKDATVRRTHVFASTRAAGTFGYLAPEVISGGGATEASDVYSLGRTIAQQQVKPGHFLGLSVLSDGALIQPPQKSDEVSRCVCVRDGNAATRSVPRRLGDVAWAAV